MGRRYIGQWMLLGLFLRNHRAHHILKLVHVQVLVAGGDLVLECGHFDDRGAIGTEGAGGGGRG